MPPPTAPPSAISPPDYLQIIDQPPVSSIPRPTSDGQYMEIDKSTRESSHTYASPTVEQYSYVSSSEIDRMGNRPRLAPPTGESHYY